ncbi:MAG TPA: hypothetical protein VL069_14700, partial [Opitutus sp.]|nr:hypothetical protein [Opitutus sp.]
MNKSIHPPFYDLQTSTFPVPPEDMQFLKANSDAYERVLRDLPTKLSSSDPERVLRCVQNAARSATRFHAGRFADGTIENVVLQIGSQLASREQDSGTGGRRSGPAKRRVLHVVSTAISIGGLSRMIWHWVSKDSSSIHSIVLLDQREIPIPSWLSVSVAVSGGAITTFPSAMSLTDKARQLRRLSRAEADLVVLHHGGWDVLPTLAFASEIGPPVAVLNHADHEFWLGSSIADLVINLRTVAAVHTRERRFIERNVVLPIPLDNPTAQLSKEEAKRRLGISPDETVLVSIAR